jgi:hypothetical protein
MSSRISLYFFLYSFLSYKCEFDKEFDSILFEEERNSLQKKKAGLSAEKSKENTLSDLTTSNVNVFLS